MIQVRDRYMKEVNKKHLTHLKRLQPVLGIIISIWQVVNPPAQFGHNHSVFEWHGGIW